MIGLVGLGVWCMVCVRSALLREWKSARGSYQAKLHECAAGVPISNPTIRHRAGGGGGGTHTRDAPWIPTHVLTCPEIRPGSHEGRNNRATLSHKLRLGTRLRLHPSSPPLNTYPVHRHAEFGQRQ